MWINVKKDMLADLFIVLFFFFNTGTRKEKIVSQPAKA